MRLIPEHHLLTPKTKPKLQLKPLRIRNQQVTMTQGKDLALNDKEFLSAVSVSYLGHYQPSICLVINGVYEYGGDDMTY
jgi:hypothetical protein